MVEAVNSIIETGWELYYRNRKLPPAVRGLIVGTPYKPKLEGWFDKESGLCLVGRLDACVRTDIGYFAPVDHKVRGSVPSVVDDRYVLQLDAYELLLEKNGYPPSGIGYLDFYMPSGRLDSGLSLDVVVLEVETSGDRASEWMARARWVLDHREPPPSAEDCEYCRWSAVSRR